MTLRIVLAFTLVLAGCSKSEPPPPPQPTAAPATKRKDPEAARKLIDGGAVVLDVRTEAEYAEAHLPNAVNIPVQQLATRLAEVDKLVAGNKSSPIVVYCSAGSRAAKAKTQLDAAGYANVTNGGGLDDLQ
ncbi:MAG TPA: rhodanese-like domain-containing protein [Kofleriaceae bacterium]